MTASHVSDASISYARFQSLAPAAVAGLRAIGRSVDEAGLDKRLTQLVKLRVSQINGCAFCTRLHVDMARRHGVEADKLDLLAAWRDAGVFTDRERAALAFAETLTAMPARPVPANASAQLAPWFAEAEIAQLVVTIATINAWNRIAGGLHFDPAALAG